MVSHPDHGGRLVVNAEDDADIQILIQAALELRGFRVVTVGNGPDALEAARRERPAAFVLDLKLPGMSGLETATAARAEESLKDVPVIMLTASTCDRDELRAQAVDVAAYLRKPFSPAALVAAVEEAVARAAA